jgi:hypothetical protein
MFAVLSQTEMLFPEGIKKEYVDSYALHTATRKVNIPMPLYTVYLTYSRRSAEDEKFLFWGVSSK